MDNKLSELSNNARKAANSFYNWSQLASCTSERLSCLTVEQLKETSELLSALLAELEAKDKRIAELGGVCSDASQVFKEIGNELGCNPDNESIMMAIDALKERLATPVRLPRRAPENLASVLDGYEKLLIATTFRDTWNACLDEVSRISSGFTVEGDE